MVALDQGTTSSRAIVFDHDANIVAISQREFPQIFPQPGWVEHDPMEIWASQSSTLVEVLARAGILSEDVAAIGITNQRETTILWNKHTGKPIYNAIVWQCRRSIHICEALKAKGVEKTIREKTGLLLDPYFSATKIKWLLDNVPNAREQAENGELLFGTVDTWLTWKLTEGQQHVTDPTNASRTLLYNIHQHCWDDELLAIFDIPPQILPQIKSSSSIFGTSRITGQGKNIPIAGIAGDQQSALFGQLCTEKGMIKNTYGTGCFLLMNTGKKAVTSKHGLLTTIAIDAKGDIAYALEGAVFMGGATIQWLRDELGLIHDAQDTEYFASKVDDTGGVYLVPAFVGLGAPYWQPNAKGSLVGLTRGTNRNHIIRAALESIAYQSRDLMDAMSQDCNVKLTQLNVDGGAVENDFLMQFQSSISGVEVLRPQLIETTAMGAAFLAGLAVGFWASISELYHKKEIETCFTPKIDNIERDALYEGWQKAISSVIS